MCGPEEIAALVQVAAGIRRHRRQVAREIDRQSARIHLGVECVVVVVRGRIDVLQIATERQAFRGIDLHVERVVSGLLVLLRRARGGSRRHARARRLQLAQVIGPVRDPAVGNQRAGLKHALAVESERAAGGGHDAVRGVFEPGRMLDPVHAVVGSQHVERKRGVLVRLPLQTHVHTLAFAVEVELAPARAGWDEHAIHGRARAHVLARHAGCAHIRRVAAEGAAELDAVGAGRQPRVGNIDQGTECAVIRVPGIAEQQRCLRLQVFAEIAEIDTAGDATREAVMIQRFAGTQVDRSGDSTLDHVRGRVLEYVDAGHELGRDVLETQSARVFRAEHVAAVQLAAHLGESAHRHSAALGGKAVGVARCEQVIDGDAGNSLQRFGHAAIRQRADVDRADRIDDDLGILFDFLRGLDTLAQTRHDDFGDRFILGCLAKGGGRREQRRQRQWWLGLHRGSPF